jgi:glycosyltransferase involved in cell wall biosynthesis
MLFFRYTEDRGAASGHSERHSLREQAVVPSQPPGVLILSQLFYPELVSTGQTLTELAEQLAVSGIDVEVLCGPPTVMAMDKRPPRDAVHRGIRIHRVWGTRFPKLNLAGRVVNQLTFTCSVLMHLLLHRPKKPILVLTNPPFLAVVCALLRSLRVGAPYIFLIFDVYPDTAVQLGILKDHGIIARLWDRANRFVFKHASAIVVIGRCMHEVISKKAERLGHPLNGELRAIHIWSDDANIANVKARENPLIDRFGTRGKFVVEYSGNMGRFHDMETIMEAANLLRDVKDIVFLLVGEGHKKRWMMDFAREKKLANCQFHTYVPREQLGQLLCLADVGLVSLVQGQEGLSVPSKTFGMMAAGVPIVAVMSDRSEVARVIEEENCGVVIRPGDSRSLADAILAFHHDRTKCKSAGQRSGRAIETRYNLREAAREYQRLIQEFSL